MQVHSGDTERKTRPQTRASLSRAKRVQEPPSKSIQTTLYDLIAAIQDSLDADDSDEMVTATMIHLWQTHRVMGTGRLKGRRLLCDVPRSQPEVPGRETYSPYSQQLSAV